MSSQGSYALLVLLRASMHMYTARLVALEFLHMYLAHLPAKTPASCSAPVAAQTAQWTTGHTSRFHAFSLSTATCLL